MKTPDAEDADVDDAQAGLHALPPVPDEGDRPVGLDVRAIAEAALLLDVTVLLSLIRVFLPIPGFQGLVRLACPIPFIILTLRRGVRAGLVATAASYILLSTFVGPILSTQILVFGGLGTVFAWASQHGWRQSVTIVTGALLYGLLYLLPPFLFSIFVLRIDLAKTLSDVHKNADSFLNGLGHFQFLGLPISAPIVSGLSGSALGRAILNAGHAVALALLQHPLATLVVFFSLYSLINVWAYLIVSIELYRRLPVETRRDAQGRHIDFFPLYRSHLP